MTISREIRLRAKPNGAPAPGDFELATVDVPPPGPGEVQVRNLWMSVDPWMLRALREAVGPEAPPQPSKFGSAVVGKALHANAVGEVIASRDPNFTVGDLVLSLDGWREAFNTPAKDLERLAPGRLPPQAYLGVGGLTGLAAYAGVTKVLDVKAGETLLVTAAAGAVGSTACQIAKIRGATVIGSAGGPEKAAFLEELGVDGVIDYKAEPDLDAALARVAPQGVDAVFENVGGAHLAAGLNAAKPFARVLLCGLMTGMAGGAPEPVPTNLMRVVRQRIRIEGFSAGDHFGDLPTLRAQLADWLDAGQLRLRDTVADGIEAAPGALLGLATGGNVGKMLVKLG